MTSARDAPPAKSGEEPSRPSRRWRLPFSALEGLAVLSAANLILTVGLGVRVYRGDKPTVMTVGITQMTREYMARLATTPGVTPQEANLRTRLYLAVAQDAVKTAAANKGVLVVPRECVLAGEYADLTGDVARAVNATMQAKVRAMPRAAQPPAPLPLQPVLGGDLDAPG